DDPGACVLLVLGAAAALRVAGAAEGPRSRGRVGGRAAGPGAGAIRGGGAGGQAIPVANRFARVGRCGVPGGRCRSAADGATTELTARGGVRRSSKPWPGATPRRRNHNVKLLQEMRLAGVEDEHESPATNS